MSDELSSAQDTGFTIPTAWTSEPRVWTETEKLLARIREFAEQLATEFPAISVAKALVASGADLVVMDHELGPLAAIHMLNKVASMAAGHFTPYYIDLFVGDLKP